MGLSRQWMSLFWMIIKEGSRELCKVRIMVALLFCICITRSRFMNLVTYWDWAGNIRRKPRKIHLKRMTSVSFVAVLLIDLVKAHWTSGVTRPHRETGAGSSRYSAVTIISTRNASLGGCRRNHSVHCARKRWTLMSWESMYEKGLGIERKIWNVTIMDKGTSAYDR